MPSLICIFLSHTGLTIRGKISFFIFPEHLLSLSFRVFHIYLQKDALRWISHEHTRTSGTFYRLLPFLYKISFHPKDTRKLDLTGCELRLTCRLCLGAIKNFYEMRNGTLSSMLDDRIFVFFNRILYIMIFARRDFCRFKRAEKFMKRYVIFMSI